MKLRKLFDKWIANRAFNALYLFMVNNDIELTEYEQLINTLELLDRHCNK